MNTGRGTRGGNAETEDHAVGSFRHGLKDSTPVGISFFFIFLAVGAASKAVGLTLGMSTLGGGTGLVGGKKWLKAPLAGSSF